MVNRTIGTMAWQRPLAAAATWAVLLALAAGAGGCKSAVSGDAAGGHGGSGSDASLRELVLTADGVDAILTPAFSGDVHVYAADVRAATQALTLRATATDPAVRSIQLVELGGATSTVASGVDTAVTPPAGGATSTLRLLVTAADGVSTAGYTVQLHRRALGTVGTLASLTDSAGVLAFTGATSYTYTVSEAQAVGYTIVPTLTDPFASLTIDGTPAVSGAPTAIDLASGSATVAIAVTSEDGNAQTSYTLHITVPHIIPVTGITLSRTSLTLGANQAAVPLVATVSPANATDTAVTWTSSDPTTVQVDGAGNLTALKAGRQLAPVTITATTHDGAHQATASVYALWFYDDFENGSDQWDLLPLAGGSFGIVSDGSSALKYTVGTSGGLIATLKSAAWKVPGGDYFVEARIKPMTNSNTGSKLLYLLARYQDASNWYGGGLNVQSSTSSTQVEVAKMAAATLTRPVQVKKPISMDTTWYTVRFELSGSTLSVYLDGELVKTTTDTAFTSGRIGLYTANKQFELDDVKVGDPADKPVVLTVSPATAYMATVGDPARTITVTAQRPDYTSGTYVDDTFTAVSDNPGAVTVQVTGKVVTLTPVGAGTANIVFTSGSNPAVTKTIQATITTFTMPTATYSLTGVTTPADNATGVNADQRLSITFDTGSTPVLGTGSVRIFRKDTGALADVILPVGEVQTLGYPGQTLVRKLNASLLAISGTTLTITPHHNALAYGTEYYVAISSDLLTGTINLNGTPWSGIGTAGDWSFTTKAAPAAGLTSLTVDDDGTADFRTVQGALDYFMQNAALDTPVTVNVKIGTYEEPLYLRGKNNVSIIGEDRDLTLIRYRNAEQLNGGSGASQDPASTSPAGGRSLFLVEGSDLLTLQTLTLKNTFVRSASASSQAETIYFNNDAGRLVAKQAAFLSEQDTLQLKGYSWFYQCLVAGNVDFIWGNNRVSLFEDSEIRTIGDSAASTSGWYVVQARTVTAADKGFVFLNSRLTHGAGPVTGDVTGNTYLARAGAQSSTVWYDNVVYVNCAMDSHITAVGWNTVSPNPLPNPSTPTQTAGWREYGSTMYSSPGTPLDVSGRTTGIQLTAGTVAAGYTDRTQILQGFNGGAGWVPVP